MPTYDNELADSRDREARANARVTELEQRCAELEKELKQARIGARFQHAHQVDQVRRWREISESEQQAVSRSETSIKLLEKAHEREQVAVAIALEKAHTAERKLFAAKIIQLRSSKMLQSEHDQALQKLRKSVEMHVRHERFAEITKEAADSLKEQEAIKASRAMWEAKQLKFHARDGHVEPLGHWLKQLVMTRLREMATQHTAATRAASSKFDLIDIQALTMGNAEEAARGLETFLMLDHEELHQRLANGTDGIRMEVNASGDAEVIECFEYVTAQRAGSSQLIFGNSPYPRDCDATGLREDRKDAKGDGMRLADFLHHEIARRAELKEAHVVALRLYSTAAFKMINTPLRDHKRTTAHPLAATVKWLADAIKMLRAVDTEKRQFDLWRGMKNLDVLDSFTQKGGTEFATMSTTSDIDVAVQYGLSTHSLLFKVVANSFMERGADIAFLSTFPGEKEFVYPPLTYLEPTGGIEQIVIEAGEAGPEIPGASITVVEVHPKFT